MFLLQRAPFHRRVSSLLFLSESRSIPRYGGSPVPEQRVVAQKTPLNPSLCGRVRIGRMHDTYTDTITARILYRHAVLNRDNIRLHLMLQVSE